jgi:tRNA C32,U32 (ribose-2'-O)-methylase TrmJ
MSPFDDPPVTAEQVTRLARQLQTVMHAHEEARRRQERLVARLQRVLRWVIGFAVVSIIADVVELAVVLTHY